jgi:hypothetical protein
VSGTVSGHLGFEGGRVSAPDIDIETPEGRLRLEGWADVTGEMPRVDARGRFELNLAQLGRFAGATAASLAGTANGTVTVTGALVAPVLGVDLAAEQVAYRSLKDMSVSAASTFAEGRLEVQRLDVTSGFGDVRASGVVSFSGDSNATPGSRVAASFRGFDVDRVLDAIGVKSPLALGARTTGQLDLRLEGVEPFGPDWLGHLSGGASAQLLPSPTGTMELDLRSGKWSLEHSVRSTAARSSVVGIVSGNLLTGPASVGSTLTGSTRVQMWHPWSGTPVSPCQRCSPKTSRARLAPRSRWVAPWRARTSRSPLPVRTFAYGVYPSSS